MVVGVGFVEPALRVGFEVGFVGEDRCDVVVVGDLERVVWLVLVVGVVFA